MIVLCLCSALLILLIRNTTTWYCCVYQLSPGLIYASWHGYCCCCFYHVVNVQASYCMDLVCALNGPMHKRLRRKRLSLLVMRMRKWCSCGCVLVCWFYMSPIWKHVIGVCVCVCVNCALLSLIANSMSELWYYCRLNSYMRPDTALAAAASITQRMCRPRNAWN